MRDRFRLALVNSEQENLQLLLGSVLGLAAGMYTDKNGSESLPNSRRSQDGTAIDVWPA